jgi:hypothetical protein
MPKYNKVMHPLKSNKLHPITTFEGTQIIDESTNYERYDSGPTTPEGAGGKSMWNEAMKIKGAKDQRFGIPGLGRGKK